MEMVLEVFPQVKCTEIITVIHFDQFILLFLAN